MADLHPNAVPRLITLRYPGHCRDCQVELAVGTKAFHLKNERTVICQGCTAGAVNPDARPLGASSPALADLAAPSLQPPRQSLPGTSAQREFDRRHAAREDALLRKWGRAGKLIALWRDDPQSTRAWSKGARGEREAGAYLEDRLRATACEVLHDRGIPGSRANIDHIVIGPAGVTVLDTKNIKGRVRTRKASWRRRTLLTINGRDSTALIDGVRRQVAAVERVLAGLQPAISVPVAGGLLWWQQEGMPLFREVAVDEITVHDPGSSWKFASRPGDLSLAQIAVVAEFLDRTLKPA